MIHSDELLPVTENGKDDIAESDHVSSETFPTSDTGALMTFNGVEHNDPAACSNHLVSEADRDLLSQLDHALASYIDGSAEAI